MTQTNDYWNNLLQMALEDPFSNEHPSTENSILPRLAREHDSLSDSDSDSDWADWEAFNDLDNELEKVYQAFDNDYEMDERTDPTKDLAVLSTFQITEVGAFFFEGELFYDPR